MVQPPIMLFDEPLTSFDVVAAHEIKQMIRSAKEDSIILFSTHILQLAQDLCDEVVLLNNHQLTGIDPSHIHEPDFEKEIVTLLTEGSPMLQWIKLYWLYEETIFSTKANGFLFLTKIPLIGKHLPMIFMGNTVSKMLLLYYLACA